MLVDFDVDTMLRALRIPVEKLKAKEIDSVKDRVTCLRWELGSTPGLGRIKDAVRRGFEQHLDIRLTPAGLTAAEEALFRSRLPHYRSAEWIDPARPRLRRRETLQAAYKSEAGLVRLTLVVDLRRQQRVREFYHHRGFLFLPPPGALRPGGRVEGSAPRPRTLCAGPSVDSSTTGALRIPGMTVEDFVRPLDLLFEKIDIARIGPPPGRTATASARPTGPLPEVLD